MWSLAQHLRGSCVLVRLPLRWIASAFALASLSACARAGPELAWTLQAWLRSHCRCRCHPPRCCPRRLGRGRCHQTPHHFGRPSVAICGRQPCCWTAGRCAWRALAWAGERWFVVAEGWMRSCPHEGGRRPAALRALKGDQWMLLGW